MNGKRMLLSVGILLFISLLRFLLPREGTLLMEALSACIRAEGPFLP